MAPGYLHQRPIVPETKKIRTLLPGFGFFMFSEKGRGLALRRISAKLRAYMARGTYPCGMVTLLAATQRAERWVSYFS
ncbi:hypothetical protein CK627_07330 [Aeromonas dhakensis]|nr:hypothetical protein CK627_07330 [Aeromonas dhakensis]